MKVALQKGAKLGFGTFGTVYRATEPTTGRAVALKQSRVSLRIKRSLLQHEAQVLKLLAGHPAIPQVYAYGRIKHFEVLSMQLLGQSLGGTVKAQGPLPVAAVTEIADQLLSALSHIHGKGLIHRDIKPDNILLLTPGSWNVCIIDFGFTYPAPREVPAAKYSSDPSRPTAVFGTLSYASLNSHEGLKLTYRDDLESLAYTLICLLRGSLPWSYYTKHGTILGRIRQVRAQKQSLTGSRLTIGLPNEFGELVDYARSLSAGEIPDYQAWSARLGKAVRVTDQGKSNSMAGPAQLSPDSQAGTRPPPPIHPGQITLVKLIPSITAEGYSIQAGHETSYIPDPRFSIPEWDSLFRPCVVLGVEWIDWANAYRFTAVPISENRELEHGSNRRVLIMNSESPLSHSLQDMVSPVPDWPLKRSYCYAFKRPTTFYCLPSQATVPSFWVINPGGVKVLATSLTPPRDPNPFAKVDDLRSSDPDTRHDAQIRKDYASLYAHVSPLTPAHITSESVDWNSTRAWFDECVKASRYHYKCNGDRWTCVLHTPSNEESDGELSDSYRGDDFESWELQQERDQSLTLAPVLEGNDIQLADVLEGLDEIELVE
ncbi:hypothetical protein FRC11_013231 [Ceratobasidium sp. 423]|nr:hypothetical protein FRC11_013231 [Ceratobasidium sp. 423]